MAKKGETAILDDKSFWDRINNNTDKIVQEKTAKKVRTKSNKKKQLK